LIVIIGGTSGIGLETAKYFKQKGKKVLICGRNNINADINFEYVDVKNEESVKKLFQSIDKISTIIYSAGITTLKKSIEDFDSSIWENIIDVNVTGAMRVLKHSYKGLKESKANIIIINSFAARTYSYFSGVEYTMSKNALSGLVKQLSQDFAKDGIRINAVYPSMTATPMLLKNVSIEKLAEIEKQIPLGRIANPIEIVKAIEFLIDATYMTGCGIDLNGGQYLNG
jgi:NAD(P)-dependent dehydrogenase (short-subunit alcohol dehydrogenase family)